MGKVGGIILGCGTRGYNTLGLRGGRFLKEDFSFRTYRVFWGVFFNRFRGENLGPTFFGALLVHFWGTFWGDFLGGFC